MLGSRPHNRLLFKGSKTGAYLTVERSDGHRVPVGVWSVTEDDEKRLDHYEGYPHFYYKTEMDITYIGIHTDRKRRCRAFLYIMHEERQPGIPSWVYVNTCRRGYADFGFDKEILAAALKDTMDAAKRRQQLHALWFAPAAAAPTMSFPHCAEWITKPEFALTA